MGLIETVIAEVVKRAFNRDTRKIESEQWSQHSLRAHLTEVANWSSRIEFLGLADARLTDRDTVALFVSLPRKFRGPRTNWNQSDETDLLSAAGNVVLLGDPGAGKTTTLKRIARMVLDTPVSPSDTSEYPIFVRLRDVGSELVLEEAIARALGVTTTREITETVFDGKNAIQMKRTIQVMRILCGKRLAIDVLAEIANTSGAIFLFDGLDEVRPELRERTENTLLQLARQCDSAKIRLTCRSGDYSRHLEGYDPLELCPLDDAQMSAIIERWCADPEEFGAALNRLPFRDLASRPLFLCELIVLFDKSGFLPQQPAAVYRRIIILALEEWDRSKRVERRSRYAGFDPSRKFEFLAAAAFHLTYHSEQKFFTPQSFAATYEAIRQNFDLPHGEARQVFSELESHTGVIVESGFERYEFSHLSLQEFLAADYLVRDRIGAATVQQMLMNPAPLAVSVAMSSNPSQRLAALLLAPWVGSALKDFNFDSLLSRVAQERTILRRDVLLGFVALAIIFSGRHDGPFVKAFLAEPVVLESIGLALKAYTAKTVMAQSTELRLQLQSKWQQAYDVALPRGGIVSMAQLTPVLDVCMLQLHPIQTYKTGQAAFESQYSFIPRDRTT